MEGSYKNFRTILCQKKNFRHRRALLFAGRLLFSFWKAPFRVGFAYWHSVSLSVFYLPPFFYLTPVLHKGHVVDFHIIKSERRTGLTHFPCRLSYVCALGCHPSKIRWLHIGMPYFFVFQLTLYVNIIISEILYSNLEHTDV